MMTNPELSPPDAQWRSEILLRLEAQEKKLAELQPISKGAMRDVQDSLGLQAAAIDSLRADLKRLEDLVAWVVDLLEVLQSNALDQPPGTITGDEKPAH